MTYVGKKWRKLQRWARRHRPVLVVSAVLCLGLVAYTYSMDQRKTVDPATYTNLLQLIARVESRDNYNAYFGHASNTTIDFTAMTIGEVQRWQQRYVAEGSPSSAVGRYQIISTTLASLVNELHLDQAQTFDASTQDRMAIALLERRGSEAYANGELSDKQFAANLAMEWAALPRVFGDNPEASYYDGDGLNKSLVSTSEVLQAIAPIQPLMSW